MYLPGIKFRAPLLFLKIIIKHGVAKKTMGNNLENQNTVKRRLLVK